MSGTISRGKILRADLAQWDGKTITASRPDATGGTIAGLTVGNEVDTLQVYGAGTARTRATIANAIQAIGSAKATLVFAPGTWTIDNDLTIPANLPCHIPSGCVFDVSSGKTLTFNGYCRVEYPPVWTSGAGSVIRRILPVPFDVRDAGIVANSASAATANTAILRALLDPDSDNGIYGLIAFPNATGADKYYFNNIIRVKDGIHMDVCWSTLHFSKSAESTDTGSGFIWPLRNFTIENFIIEVDYDMASISSSAGYALKIGGRGDDNTTYWPGLWDSELDSPMGQITIRNGHISSNVSDSSGGAIAMTGGLKGVVVENIEIDGQSNTLYNGIVYEFGWATSGTTNLRQTSHMSEAIFRNIRINDINTSAGTGIILGGAYNYTVDGLFVSSAAAVFSATPGESLFYRPWSGVDDLAKSGTQIWRNIVGIGILSTSGLVGAQSASGGYLSAIISALSTNAEKYVAQTDLASYIVEGCSISGGGGFLVSGPCSLKKVNMFGGVLALTDECVQFSVADSKVLDSSAGVRLNIGGAIWSPVRLKIGSFDNCFFAGNASAGMTVNNSKLVHLRSCRFGYSSLYEEADETVQTNCVVVAGGSGGGGVIADGCFMTPVSGNNSYSITGTPTSACDIRHPRGTVAISGPWSINGIASATATQIADKTSSINTSDKYLRKMCFDSSNSRLMISLGGNDTSNWVSADDHTTTVTPS